IECDNGTGCAIQTDSDDLLGRGAALLEGEPNGVRRSAPPGERLLFGPGRLGICRLDRSDAKGDRAAFQIDQGCSQALGSYIQAEQEPRAPGNRFHRYYPSACELPRDSSRNVTGPSLINSTFIMAPKTPVATVSPDFLTKFVKKL